MHAHQIITGALNNGENVYSIGNIEGLTFTACAVGNDVVILDSSFNRVQIVPGKNHFLVSSISCCQETGKIAATCGNSVKILEAISSGKDKSDLKSLIFQFTWIETYLFTNNDSICSVLWTMEGMRILFVSENKLILHQHKNVSAIKESTQNSPVTFSISYEDIKQGCPWDVIWTSLLPFKPMYIRYSPDGFYLAVSGENDCFIKIYYQNGKDNNNIKFSVVTLPHPAPVCGFEWRKTGRYMPKKCIFAVLVSWCSDRTSRIWKESPPPETSIIDLTGESGGEPLWEKQKSKKFLGKHMKVKKTKTKILKKLRSLIPEKKSETEDHAIGMRAQIGKSPSSFDIQLFPRLDYNESHFHLAASINSETDCLLVPSLKEQLSPKHFCVHWLNNKELLFSVGAEKLLAEAVLMDIEGASGINAVNQSVIIGKKNDYEKANPEKENINMASSVCSESPSSKDILDVKLEILLRQWNKTNDVLFAIHPIDGSLLTWTVEWLDDNFRHPVVSYSSRLPFAIPSSDSSSIHSKLNTFNPHEPVYLDALRNDSDNRENSTILEKTLERRVSNTIHVLTSHDNGTLNLWHMSVDDQSGFSHISSITHVSRMCGHRFQMQQIVAHPVLPLLLTTSKGNPLITHTDSTPIQSEVILWKITPVGPLCKSGGVKELARVTSSDSTGFTTVCWIPVILPSHILGTAYNSPSSCFISYDGENLIIYQAVLDARGVLSKLEAADFCHNDSINDSGQKQKVFTPASVTNLNVVSTQSTAKPGCVLEIGRLENINIKNKDLMFVHVFQAKIVLAEENNFDCRSNSGVIDRSQSPYFNDSFFVILIDNSEEADIILMFQLTISSLQSSDQTSQNNINSEFELLANTCNGALGKLNFDGQLVCRQVLPVPNGTRLKKMEPAAGHLSSASLYPACDTPYVLISSGDDDTIRFWKCSRNSNNDSSNLFEWHEWNMIGNNGPNELSIEETIIDVSAAHSGRLACAYNKSNCYENCSSKKKFVQITVFECESSGGVEWINEDSFTIEMKGTLQLSERNEEENSFVTKLENSNDMTPKSIQFDDMVKLAWVSTEDGSHMLTVGIETNVYIYAQISQDPAQHNVTLMKESETTMRRPSIRKASSLLPSVHENNRFTNWVCCRVLKLDSADGLPAIPSALSWVRDGVLIVGLQSEMRVYNQWNFKSTEDSKYYSQKKEPSREMVNLTMTTSHAMLDRLIRKQDALVSNRSRAFFDLVSKKHSKDNESVLDILRGEGVFEAARLCSPILPQYHPKQLIALLNAGKQRRVKAILNHILTALKRNRSFVQNPLSRAASIKRFESLDQEKSTININLRTEDDFMDYEEVEDIPLLPLHMLIRIDGNSDTQSPERSEKLLMEINEATYNDLFINEYEKDDDIDELLNGSNTSETRSRHVSVSSDKVRKEQTISSIFTASDNRKLTEILTHSHLPGLSSVDQMHLLAIADTLSHFTNDGNNKLEQANAAMEQKNESVLGNATAGGYATASAGIDSVDECGLKYLMAMKQHEYLLVCLPIKQRIDLKKNGLAPADIIWAQHSETEIELLNAVSGLHKSNITWEELKGLGIAWWLKNTSSLKICIEKLAKAAFQSNQDPMDASLFYLAMRKKNVLTHLFKTVGNQTMADFFMNDFNCDRWKKVAAKNAFVLMSKQRFHHAAAFFLLSGSLKDAVQTIMSKCNDLQLALVVTRLYETDIERQQSIINSILCKEVLGISVEVFNAQKGKNVENGPFNNYASKEPFERSMAFWMMKDYSRAAYTLVQEAQSDHNQSALSNIFNFYSFLRKHPLVVRQRLSNASVQVGSTEKFLALGRQMESILTPPERRLFFRTAAEHMSRGCPMLSLDVLMLLPARISIVHDYEEALKTLFTKINPTDDTQAVFDTVLDWSEPTVFDKPEALELEWSDDEESGKMENVAENETPEKIKTTAKEGVLPNLNVLESSLIGCADIFAQHMKFVASIQIITEELSTLASGIDMEGTKLRFQLLDWLKKEITMLHENCDYYNGNEETQNQDKSLGQSSKKTWLKSNQKLLRSFTSYCTLHSAHNHKLTAVLMELLILLLKIQQDSGEELLPTDVKSFPLLDAATTSRKMFVSSPFAFVKNQCSDLLASIEELTTVPNLAADLRKCYMLYNLSQGFASSLYQSLCGTDKNDLMSINKNGNDGSHVITPPVKWPGAETLIALLGRETNENAPQLRLLIVEAFFAITMSLFCFALSTNDSRWLYRLAANEIDPFKFGMLFGGGGCNQQTNEKQKPPRPIAPIIATHDENKSDGDKLRFRLNLRILGDETSAKLQNCQSAVVNNSSQLRWVSPKKNIVHFYAEKPIINKINDEDAYDSDEDDKNIAHSIESNDEDKNVCCEEESLSNFAWQLLRLAVIQQQMHRFKQFLILVGIDPQDVPSIAPRVEGVLRQMNLWMSQQHEVLNHFPGGIPNDLLPDMTIESQNHHLAATLKKYAVLVKKNNTPFETDEKTVRPIQRLWTFLVNEDHLQETFIKYIFSHQEHMPDNIEVLLGNETTSHLPDAFKIVQKDAEPIVAFSCNQECPGLIVVSNGKELQEMDLSDLFKDQSDYLSWIWNRADLDIKNMNLKRDVLRENDDYQIFNDSDDTHIVKNTNVMIKRPVAGVRRIDSHPNAPFYVTGSSDGSIKVWRWGTSESIYTARLAGQHAKVTKVSFSCNGNKFAAVDGDGMLCLWQAGHATEQKKPFFSQRCHNKSAADVRFLGYSSSVLLTAGSSSLDFNLGLWDTLLPTNRSLVHSWVAHPEGATCAMYVPSQQTIFSGGRHGEICLWDIRQRQLRATIKAFDQTHLVKNLVSDLSQDLIVSGSSEGDIKIWSADSNPQLMYSLPSEHAAKTGFSFRQVGQSVQGVQQLFVDQNMRLFSCGADSSLKFRTLPSVFNMTNFL